MHLLSATTVVAMLVSASAATAYTRFTSRSASYAVVADCPNRPVTNVCDPTATVPFGSFPDYPGVEDYQPTHEAIDTTAFARLFPVGGARSHGSATAYSVTTPGDLLPSLKAGAFTRPDELGRFTTSYAYVSTLFAYTYVGAEPVALPLVGTLDATISFAPINFGNPLGAGSFPYSFGQLRGQLAVLNESVFTGAALDLASLTCGNAGVLSAGVGSTGRGGFALGGVTQNVSLGFDLSTGATATR